MARILPALALLAMLGPMAHAASALHVHDAWIREAPPGATALAGYLIVDNPSASARTLASVSSPDFAAVEMHTTQIVEGTASMQPLKDIVIPAHGQRVLAPGGAHLMLLHPRRALSAGDKVNLQLHFSGGVTLRITTVVMREPPAILHHH
jgi:periplasmic copper chaperone A